ncbi:hypothetical protein [Nitrosomonas sp. Nm34]|nr:hypothetical protein [Nitrosomonas sp. Nm34]
MDQLRTEVAGASGGISREGIGVSNQKLPGMRGIQPLQGELLPLP